MDGYKRNISLEEELDDWIKSNQAKGMIWITMNTGNKDYSFGLIAKNISKIEIREEAIKLGD